MAAYVAWLLRRDEQRSLRRERLFRKRITIRDVPEHILERCYRMPKEGILGLCNALAPSLRRPTMRSCALPFDVQVLLALRFYASGSFQSVVGDVIHSSQPSASRVVNSMSQAIVLMATEGIRFPTTRRAVSLTSLGCIDGTHIAIKVSKEDKPAYLNRKGYTSINLQAICNSESIITKLTVKWPGNTHDSYMWWNCDLYDQFGAGTGPDGWLLVDVSDDEEEEEEAEEEDEDNNNNGPGATKPRRARPMNPGILGSSPTLARFDLDEHRTSVRSCITTASRRDDPRREAQTPVSRRTEGQPPECGTLHEKSETQTTTMSKQNPVAPSIVYLPVAPRTPTPFHGEMHDDVEDWIQHYERMPGSQDTWWSQSPRAATTKAHPTEPRAVGRTCQGHRKRPLPAMPGTATKGDRDLELAIALIQRRRPHHRRQPPPDDDHEDSH
ncbi:hypothetical protein HPB47_016360 [Ixodes persulcatus]|uniref:Uncharacterized protein n=1 Tax=Ixodes persulcatus TaxID=34615 RepID=A0AC60QR58_IXOPE|nr:hypothetical protein HPB47_016360 [Ixodes persulcatus]